MKRTVAGVVVALVLGVLAPGGVANARPIPPPPGAPVVTPGAFCSGGGRVGVTVTGLAMGCITTATDSRFRWRNLDSSLYPTVGSVDRLYSAYFLREADGGGFAYWFEQYGRGVPLGGISENFALSAEFQGRYGALTSGDFVKLVYRNVLGREPEPTGYDYWAPLVESRRITRGQMLVGFSESPEYKARTGTV